MPTPHPDTLPRVSKVESTARVTPDREPAVVLWFAPGDRALRYHWSPDEGEILEETYYDGVVHDSWGVGGSRDELAEYALESLAEYINHYREYPDDCRQDWPGVYELLTVDR